MLSTLEARKQVLLNYITCANISRTARLATKHEQLEPGSKRLKIKDFVSRDNNYSIPIHNLCKHIKYGEDR